MTGHEDPWELQRHRFSATKRRVYRAACLVSLVPVIATWRAVDSAATALHPAFALGLLAAAVGMGSRWVPLRRFEVVSIAVVIGLVVLRVATLSLGAPPGTDWVVLLTADALWVLPVLLVAAVLMFGRRTGILLGTGVLTTVGLLIGAGVVRQLAHEVPAPPLSGLVRVLGFQVLLLGLLLVVARIPEMLDEAWRHAVRSDRYARTDPLTGLPNRRAGQEALDRTLANAERSGAPAAALLLDLDGFKPVNDRDGHAAGDRVLVEVARLLRDSVRSGDVAARWGGDEFLIVAPDADRSAAEELAARLRQGLADAEPAGYPVTATVGVAAWTPSMTAEDLLTTADAALYLGKRARQAQGGSSGGTAQRGPGVAS